MKIFAVLTLLLTLVAGGLKAAETQPAAPQWADFVERDFPFFSSVLDARKWGSGWPTNNLTPRGLILNLGNNCWACFDTDLLRVSAVWTGAGVTPVSMSQGSYHTAGEKAPEGQGKLPEIQGVPWLANGIYPGWQMGENIFLNDPREPVPEQREVGRGPLPTKLGRFLALQVLANGVLLEYEVGGTTVQEWLESSVQDGAPMVQRNFRFARTTQPLWLALGSRPMSDADKLEVALDADQVNGQPVAQLSSTESGFHAVRVSAVDRPFNFSVTMSLNHAAKTWKSSLLTRSTEVPLPRWARPMTTRGINSTNEAAYVTDDIALPTDNPWRRNVRLADIAFFSDGRAAAVTFDGDVWLISGLQDELSEVVWRRFASGLHEPLSLGIQADKVYVFDRNGIWRLSDTDDNGEADRHELIANNFTQTAETREYANSMKLAPDGSFIIAKGGQQGSSIGKHNGSVLRVSPDGETVEEIGWGLRQPFLGVHPRTGMITASDQQGHYVPATPLHVIRDHQYYGFLASRLPREKYPAPIADPLVWLPHSINPSAAAQVWLTGSRMGALTDKLIHIGYYRPEAFVVLLNERTTNRQAAVMSLTRDFQFPPLSGAVNPRDGQLYLTGFQIWGTTANKTSGLARVRYTGALSPFPQEIVPMQQGILLSFDFPLYAPQATNLANYSVELWNYKRTAEYGSPHYKLNGEKGQETLLPASVYLSKDRRRVFLGLPDMQPVMQMRLGWGLMAESGETVQNNAYFTPRELIAFDPVKEGFENVTVDLTPRNTVANVEATPITVEEGRRVAELMGCVACHSTDGSTLGKVGPSWKGLFGRERELAGGGKTLVDESYLRESIKEPAAKIAAGFDKSDTGMPSYEGVITDAQIEALVLYLKSVK